MQNAEIEGSQAPWMMDFLMFWDVQAAPETIKKWGKKSWKMNGWNQAVIHLEPKYIEQNLRYLVHMEALALLGFPGEDFAVKCVAPGGGQSGNRSCENLLKAPAPQNFGGSRSRKIHGQSLFFTNSAFAWGCNA